MVLAPAFAPYSYLLYWFESDGADQLTRRVEQLEQARRSDRHQHWREVNDLKRELEELQRLADGEREMPGSYRGIGA